MVPLHVPTLLSRFKGKSLTFDCRVENQLHCNPSVGSSAALPTGTIPAKAKKSIYVRGDARTRFGFFGIWGFGFYGFWISMRIQNSKIPKIQNWFWNLCQNI